MNNETRNELEKRCSELEAKVENTKMSKAARKEFEDFAIALTRKDADIQSLTILLDEARESLLNRLRT